MKYLDRQKIPPPACLQTYTHGRDAWGDLARNQGHYVELVSALQQLQGIRCAYCECDLELQSPMKQHVEHFIQRSRAQHLTFIWANLFWSCTREDRCGKHKDHPKTSYLPADLLKPDQSNPRVFLQFLPSGIVVPRHGLSASDRQRAETTIRVFNLNGGGLPGTRIGYLTAPRSAAEEAAANFAAAELAQYLDESVVDYVGLPFSSAILDMLGVAP